MASMISYFGRIQDREEKEPSGNYCWDGNLDIGSNLSHVKCPVAQLKFLLEQSLAAAYYLKFYGPRCHEMMNEYITELNNDICYRFTRTCGKEFKDNFQLIFTTLNNLVKFNRGGNWTDINLSLVTEFLFDGTNRIGMPVVWTHETKGMLIPFLIWMNKGKDPNFLTYANEKCGIVNFYIDKESYGTSSKVGHFRVEVYSNFIGRSFSSEKTPLDDFAACSILGFLSHFDWAVTSFETAVGIISSFCLHLDINRYGLSLTHHLAYCLRQGALFPTFNIAGWNDGVGPIVSHYRDQLFNVFLAFVDYCTKNKGMSVADRNIVAKAFGSIAFTKEQKESVSYLNKADATPSADEYKSFKRVMGSVESMQLISQSPTLISAQSSQVTSATEEAGTGNGETKNDKPEPEKAKDKPNEADQKKDEPEKKETKEDDNSDASDDDDGAPDTREDDTPDGGNDAGSDSEDTGTDAGESGDSTTSTEVPSTQTGSEPEDVHLSDDRGVEFKITLPESETVDTVLFREEMDKLLTNVLTNPPKCMSPQGIATLTALKRFWLHCLSIETITGIVEACIKLPKSIKRSIHKSTELKQ